MESRDVGCTRVAELAVNLVGEEEEIIFLDQIADLKHLFHSVEIAGRVVGIADKYALCARGDQLLELLDSRKREALVNVGRYGDDLGAR